MSKERYERDDLNAALQTLHEGGLILYPTDTVWGIGCDATNAEAVRRVFELKQRDLSKPLISIVDSDAKLVGLMRHVPDIAYDLIDATTTPLTIIYPDVQGLAPGAVGEDGSAAIRVVRDEPFCNFLAMRFRKPIISTSANVAGDPTPAHFGEVSQEVIDAVDYVVKYRQGDKTKAKPSEIMKLNSDGSFEFLR